MRGDAMRIRTWAEHRRRVNRERFWLRIGDAFAFGFFALCVVVLVVKATR